MQNCLKNMKNSKCYTEYIDAFLEFIAWMDFRDKTKSIFRVFNSIKNNGETFLDEHGKDIWSDNPSTCPKNISYIVWKKK